MKIFVIGGVTGTREQGPQAEGQNENDILRDAMTAAGRSLAKGNHDILVCSPVEGSSDVNVVRGAAAVINARTRTKIEFYYPNSKRIVEELNRFQKTLGKVPLVRFPQQPPADEGQKNVEGWQHAWLLAQLAAMEPASRPACLHWSDT